MRDWHNQPSESIDQVVEELDKIALTQRSRNYGRKCRCASIMSNAQPKPHSGRRVVDAMCGPGPTAKTTIAKIGR